MKLKNIISEDNLYGNISVYSPTMDFMFFSNKKRIKFYIKNNLVNKIDDNTYQLNFIPKGNGYSGFDSFVGMNLKMMKRENKCVVTGKTTHLTRHHIVPSLFRKHFPLEYKTSFLLIVLFDRKEHDKYTAKEQEFYNVLAKKYNAPPYTHGQDIKNVNTLKAKRIAHSLIEYNKVIPLETQEQLKNKFKKLTNIEPTHENLLSYRPYKIYTNHDFGKTLVSKIDDYREFEMIWLNHFIDNTNPKFLPEDIIVAYNLNKK